MPSEPASTTIDPTTRPAHLFTLSEVLRIVVAAAVAGAAVCYLFVHNSGDETLDVLARVFSIVAMVTTLQMIFEARRVRHIDRVGERLDRIETRLDEQIDTELRGYNRGYMDCLKDRANKD